MPEPTLSPPPIDPLEAELVAVGRTLVVDPPDADLAERVLSQIAATDGEDAGAPAVPRSLFSPRRRALVAAIAALLVVVLVPPCVLPSSTSSASVASRCARSLHRQARRRPATRTPAPTSSGTVVGLPRSRRPRNVLVSTSPRRPGSAHPRASRWPGRGEWSS